MKKLPTNIGQELKTIDNQDNYVKIEDQLFICKEEKDTYIIIKPNKEANLIEIHGIINTFIETITNAYSDFNSDILTKNCMSIGIVT